jgi:predicted O-methyltransferase YrrM
MDVTVIQQKLATGALSAKILLSSARLFDESLRSSSIYADNRHFPFYYHLGRQIAPQKVIQVGPYLGLPAACFLQSCWDVKEWVCVDDPSPITELNVRLYSFGRGRVYMWSKGDCEGYRADAAFLSQEFPEADYRENLEFLWDHLESEGLLVADYITSSNAFSAFCRVKNRTPVVFQTRHSVGVIQR